MKINIMSKGFWEGVIEITVLLVIVYVLIFGVGGYFGLVPEWVNLKEIWADHKILLLITGILICAVIFASYVGFPYRIYVDAFFAVFLVCTLLWVFPWNQTQTGQEELAETEAAISAPPANQDSVAAKQEQKRVYDSIMANTPASTTPAESSPTETEEAEDEALAVLEATEVPSADGTDPRSQRKKDLEDSISALRDRVEAEKLLLVKEEKQKKEDDDDIAKYQKQLQKLNADLADIKKRRDRIASPEKSKGKTQAKSNDSPYPGAVKHIASDVPISRKDLSSAQK
ncbi:MAG: hypothetical protein KBB91_02770 [Candidatus Pacebacteria bacterium]|jgi:hypothetical protein|nr:hypothetical protein [Candidatus Paceibacterota bacterium]MBP9701061.1 hypothetical protein [Candidatus Paceibacterota bacterium]